MIQETINVVKETEEKAEKDCKGCTATGGCYGGKSQRRCQAFQRGSA